MQIFICVSEFCRKFAFFVEKLPLLGPLILFSLRCHCTTAILFWSTNWLKT